MKKLIELPERTIIIYTIILISIIPNAFNLIINMCLNKKFLEESKKNRSNLHRRSAILFNSTAQFNKNRRKTTGQFKSHNFNSRCSSVRPISISLNTRRDTGTNSKHNYCSSIKKRRGTGYASLKSKASTNVTIGKSLYNLTKNRNSVKIEKSGYTYIRQISKTGKTKYIITKHSKKCINKHRRLTDENFYEKNNNPCLTRHSVL